MVFRVRYVESNIAPLLLLLPNYAGNKTCYSFTQVVYLMNSMKDEENGSIALESLGKIIKGTVECIGYWCIML